LRKPCAMMPRPRASVTWKHVEPPRHAESPSPQSVVSAAVAPAAHTMNGARWLNAPPARHNKLDAITKGTGSCKPLVTRSARPAALVVAMNCSQCASSILAKGYTNVPGIGNLCIQCHGQWMASKRMPDLWVKIDPPPPPTCDLCARPVAWAHPAGGLRCDRCPRPDKL